MVCSNICFFLLSWKMNVCSELIHTRVHISPSAHSFIFVHWGTSHFRTFSHLINKKVENLAVYSLITAKCCKGYWLACLFVLRAAVSSQSCLQNLFSFPREESSIHRKKKKNMLSSSVINTEGSELKTVPAIQKEISAAWVNALLEELVTCGASFSKMAVLFESNSVSSNQTFHFIAGECMRKVPVQVLFLLVLVPGKLLKIL